MKIGVLGVGHLGKIHLRCIQGIEAYELVGFFDTDRETGEKISKEFGIKQYDRYVDLIDDVEVVSIVTPTSSHFEYARAAITRRRHVFIEKPLVNSIHEASELIKLAEEAGVKVQVGHVERFNPAFLAVRDYVQDPKFMEAHRLSQFNPRGVDVPVVYDLMIHDIDIVLGLVNAPIKRISASGVPVISNTPDIANARLEFDNGAVANLTASRISLKKMRKLRFFQKDAYILVDFLDKKAQVIQLMDNNQKQDLQPGAMVIPLQGMEDRSIHLYEPRVEEINAIQTELKGLYDAIVNDTTPIVTINDGYNALFVAQEIMDKIEY